MATIYVTHRENQAEGILDAAAELFIRHGIEQVTISAIATNARLTRATIYKYFSNKEEIAQEIFKSITQGWRDRNEQEVWSFQGTGYQRLEKFITSFFAYLFENPKEASFVAEVNYLYAKAWSAEEFEATMLGNLNEDKQFVLGCIREGIQDGSLRSDMEPELFLAVFFNFLSGMISRFGSMGDKVAIEFGKTAQETFMQINLVFLSGLKKL